MDIAAICEKHDLLIIADEVYSNYNYEEEFIGDGLRYELMTFLNVIRQEKSAVYEQMKEISLAIAKAQEIFLHLRFVKRNSGDNKQNG